MAFPWAAVIPGVATVAGGILDHLSGRRQAEKDRDFQREFAQHGVRWRVEDARRAGIHPLAALGAQTHAAQSYVGGHGSPFGNMARNLGQDLSRAISATRTKEERAANMLSLENMGLQNDYLRSQILRLNHPYVGPGFPLQSNSGMPLLTGQGDSVGAGRPGSPYVVEEPFFRVHSEPGRPDRAVGALPETQIVRTERGYGIEPSADMKQRIEDNFFSELFYNLRNRYFKGEPTALNEQLYPPPAGHYWKWDVIRQEWYAKKGKRRKVRWQAF